MNFFNLKTSVLRTPEFRESSVAGRGTWLVLVSHCVEQENGGRIENCRRWTDRLWLEICGVSLSEVEECSSLLHWEGNDLRVEFYPVEMEAAMRERRENGRTGGLKSGEIRSTSKVKNAGAEDPASSERAAAKPKISGKKAKEPPAQTGKAATPQSLQAPLQVKGKDPLNVKEGEGNEEIEGKRNEKENEQGTGPEGPGAIAPTGLPSEQGQVPGSEDSPPGEDPEPVPPTAEEVWLAGFDEFWRGYPRKDARSRALKAWKSLAAQPKPGLVQILKALAHQSASENWLEDRGRFIPHAATWLNGRRWEDSGLIADNPAAETQAISILPSPTPIDPDGLSPMQRQWAETKRLAGETVDQ